MFVFGWAMLPLHYLTSMLFSVPSTGFTRMAMLNVLTGITLFLITFILDMEIFDTKSVATTMTDVGVFFPHFSLAQGINNLNLMSSYITVNSIIHFLFYFLIINYFRCVMTLVN